MSHSSLGNVSGADLRWVAIQEKTFANWCNEQLSVSGRSVEDIETDFCDGVRLVALIESLQFRKIGRVYSKPTSRIQMLQNAALALQAIADDHIRLVNIGPEDIVNGNVKLILGLLWHLILRYQISAHKTKAPPKRLMLEWFQQSMPGLTVFNFTGDWSDGIALNALVEYCRPGTCPNWRSLDPRNRVENCRRAMQLAKEHLNVPRVISAEDFASQELDELSAMTYLSYFIKKDSPGYYATLNWVCRQLRTTNVSNLTTDWNDGYYLCAIVQSLGGQVPGWPNIDRADKLNNCQKGMDAGKELGVQPVMTAAELSDPHVDHLAVMAYLSKFRNIKPPRRNAEKLTVNCNLVDVKQGSEARFFVTASESGVDKNKVKVVVAGPAGKLDFPLVWIDNSSAECKFTLTGVGSHTVHVTYDGEEVVGSPVAFQVARDITKIKVLTTSGECRVDQEFPVKVDSSSARDGHFRLEAKSETGQIQVLTTHQNGGILTGIFKPHFCGSWSIDVDVDGEVIGDPIHVSVYDPSKAVLSGPPSGVVGEKLMCNVNYQDARSDDVSARVENGSGQVLSDVSVVSTNGFKQIQFVPDSSGKYRVRAAIKGEEIKGCPVTIDVFDPGQVTAKGEGLRKGIKGEESRFEVHGASSGDNLTVNIEANGGQVPVKRFSTAGNSCEFRYLPSKAGLYVISVTWRGRHIHGSPFHARVTDRSLITLLDDLSDRRDEKDYLVLDYDTETALHFDISQAGPGTFTAEVLGPVGKLPVHVNQTDQQALVSFKAKQEGDHYIHLYWSEAPLELSPLLAYCAGPPLPVDARQVVLTGQGAMWARATVKSEFMVDGRKAGPGKVRVEMKGVRSSLPVDVTPMKYDRYMCTYTPPFPGGFLLFVYWSDVLVPGCPHKISVTSKGDVSKVKVTGEGLKGGIAGYELRVFVDTHEAGPGEISATCSSHRQGARVDVKENEAGHYTLVVQPTTPDKHLLQIKYDDQHVPGSPFVLRIGEPPDASKVRVFGPGVEDGVIYTFQSTFLVETHGAGAGQLAVRVRGPRGSFKVDMHRESDNERTITCSYNPTETGQYVINVRWSGEHVPGSPFTVNIVENKAELQNLLEQRGLTPLTEARVWRAEI
nr:hypothetical protein BaRGS_021227 [Batillaria attramentaria]